MAVTLPESVVERYPRFSLYNSPYDAHDEGCAIDLYPESNDAPSPVAGEVIDTRTVTAPEKPYAVEHDHLILIDCGDRIARVLHVHPAVSAGDEVAVGDSLGEMVRSGFFAPWVDNHVHLGFRDPDANPYRASGSLRIEVDADLRALPWDGTGTVVGTGETYAVLDAPRHPDPGAYFAGIAADAVGPAGDDARVLDGGLPHYAGGGLLAANRGSPPDDERDVALLGSRVGVANGRTVTWDDVTVLANGEPITGLSLFLARDAGFGAKLICPDASFPEGERVTVAIRR
ncbi:hypothetical protein G9464_12080 [Halostella sp. JP-L12]|uniref:hypothetical protein n=1 Tax=Halostella TaxID=1843185 RepID=UPI000EF77D7C|nr:MULTISPECIES: hypothetical protein [Halostella]NHN48330.1 hypothetical protein [Halostella sp. JP-L12]